MKQKKEGYSAERSVRSEKKTERQNWNTEEPLNKTEKSSSCRKEGIRKGAERLKP